MYIKGPRFPQINIVYCNASENGLLPASLPSLFILPLNKLHTLPKSMALADCSREFLFLWDWESSDVLPLKHLISLGQMVHCRGQAGLISPGIGALGQNTVQSCISFLQPANTYFTTTKWMYDWNYLRLASIMSFFTATSHTCYCIFHSPKFHQLEEVKIQVLHSDFTVLWTGKLFCRTWKPWWNYMVDFFFPQQTLSYQASRKTNWAKRILV